MREERGKHNPVSKQQSDTVCSFIYLFKFNSLPSAENNTFRAYKLSRMGNSAHVSKQHACVSKQTQEVGMKMLFPPSRSLLCAPQSMSISFEWFYCKIVFCIYMPFIMSHALYLGYIVHIYYYVDLNKQTCVCIYYVNNVHFGQLIEFSTKNVTLHNICFII